jgi:hypothetical protein
MKVDILELETFQKIQAEHSPRSICRHSLRLHPQHALVEKLNGSLQNTHFSFQNAQRSRSSGNEYLDPACRHSLCGGGASTRLSVSRTLLYSRLGSRSSD